MTGFIFLANCNFRHNRGNVGIFSSQKPLDQVQSPFLSLRRNTFHNNFAGCSLRVFKHSVNFSLRNSNTPHASNLLEDEDIQTRFQKYREKHQSNIDQNTFTTMKELSLSRKDITESSSKERYFHLVSTLGAANIDDMGSVDTPIDIQLILRKSKSDFHLLGMIGTQLNATCDRCLKNYRYDATGYFELWILTDENKIKPDGLVLDDPDELDDYIEYLPNSSDSLDISPHVYDAIQLAEPSKFLCSTDCESVVDKFMRQQDIDFQEGRQKSKTIDMSNTPINPKDYQAQLNQLKRMLEEREE